MNGAPDRRLVWTTWLLTRVLLIVLLASVEAGAFTDLNYYRGRLGDLGAEGVGGTLAEYPVPAFLVLAAPYQLLALAGLTASYQVVVIVLLLMLDAGFLQTLLGRARTATPVWAWLAATPALGAVGYARFDLLPGVLVALALLHVVEAPRRAAVLAVLATGLKYSPALVLPGLAAPAASRVRVVVSGAVAGIGMVAISLAVGGWDRIVSPLTYQGDRGLQVESLAATPALLRWAVAPGEHRIFYARSLAWEIDGPWAGGLLTISTVGTALLVVALVVLWARAWLRLSDPRLALPAVVWLTLGAIAAFVASSKVFSPQYLLWLLPAACAGLVLLDGDDRRRLGRWTAVLMVTAALTHVVFPYAYRALIDGHTGWSVPVVLVLALRNLLLAGLCVAALASAWGATRRVPRRPRDPAVSRAS